MQKMKAELMRNSYLNLSSFYNRIEDYDKAIDYYVLAYQQLDNIPDRRSAYQRCIGHKCYRQPVCQQKKL
jgi:hypothetical protein